MQEKAAAMAEKMKNPGQQIFGFTATVDSPPSTKSSFMSMPNPFSSEAPSASTGGRQQVHSEPPVTQDNVPRTEENAPRTDDVLPKFGTATKPVDDHFSAARVSQSRTKQRSKAAKPIRPTLTQKVSGSPSTRRLYRHVGSLLQFTLLCKLSKEVIGLLVHTIFL